MGMEVAALAAIGITAEIGKANMETQAANAQENALDIQARQSEVQYQQKSLANLDMVQKVIDAQTAMMTVSGTAFSSPSFNAIQRDTINIGARKAKNIETENTLMQENIEREKFNVRSKLYASLFGDAANLAISGMNIYSKLPKKG